MKKTLFLALAVAALSSPAKAEDHGHKHDAAHAAMHKAHKDRMAAILADPARAEDAKRDKYRHPAETFEFFRIHPDHVVGEYAPGGEWISRTLGRYMDGSGKFNGLFFSTTVFADEKTREGVKAGAAKFPEDVAKVTGKPASDYRGFTLDAVPEGANGTFDRIIVMRMMHNLMRWNMADQEIKRMRDLLKPDGLLGIEQHRAKPDAPFAYADGSKGYLREADVIKFMEVNGFELVAKSEINANSKDSADYPDGVWTLPPTRRFDKENDAKYQAIGESDRMTLLFKKRP
ncbi:class I SAM-dependent methyltransferase [Sphingorhabdus sp.]|jgi:predicted methyltransferase|uniref:class I SAM-dependent methyltransferase n=1 Tax=Sphingorhabdus sp. TaxID=1902408 RepID=UPI0035B3C204|nr:class I SAM-dependent methyltransferase [Sphingomonadaceae bacterium]